jgi:hypothetical protein
MPNTKKIHAVKGGALRAGAAPVLPENGEYFFKWI